MKKVILSLAFAFAVTLTGFAQEKTSKAGLDSKITEQTREIAQKIGLNEREYITLRKLNQERIVQTAQVESMYSNDPEMRTMKIREIDEHFDARLIAVLNSKQQEAYASYKQTSDSPVNIAGAEEDERSAEEQAEDRR